MSVEPRREFPDHSLRCYWPAWFTERRPFDRKSENQTYLEYIQAEQYLGEEIADDEEDDEGDDEEDDEGDYEEEDEAESEDKDGASSEDDGSSNATEDEVDEQSKSTDAGNQMSDARRFMKGMERDEDFLEDYDMVDEVANFCEEGEARGPFPAHGKRVALLDERNIFGTIGDKGGHCRTNLEPLTLERLREKLKKQRLRVESDSTNAFDDEESDAERTILFVPDLNSFTMQAILKTASRNQAPPLRYLFYKYLKRKTSIGVTIPSIGFPVFTLDFHMPYWVLKKSKSSTIDPRRKSDGNPLRQSRKLDFLFRSTAASKDSNPADEHYWLHEAQISIVVTGINHWIWTAYGFVDTYFGSNETVDDYIKLKGRRGEREDPLTAGRRNGGEPIWTPREYFLTVILLRMQKVLKEWNQIVDAVTEEVERSRDERLECSSSMITAQKLIARWNRLANFSTQLITGLSETTQAWERFWETEADYFRYDGETSTASPSLQPSLIAINKVFSTLKLHRRKLEGLEKELCDRREGLNASLSLDGHAIASQLRYFNLIVMIFFPLVISSGVFSAEGVLPFTSSPTNFACFLFAVVCTMVALHQVLYQGSYWLQRGVNTVQSAINYFNKRPDGKGTSCDSEPWDVEKAPEKVQVG